MFGKRGIEVLIEFARRIVRNVQERDFFCGSGHEDRAAQREEKADESFHFFFGVKKS
jgi:hypothetical protein